MRLCRITDLEPGMVLGKSLFDENGQLLLRAGFTLDREILHALTTTGRTVIYIFEEGTEDILPEDLISEESRSRASSAFRQTMDRVAEAAGFRADIPPEKLRVVIERGAEFKNVVDVDQVTADMTSIVDEIMDSSAQVLDQTLIKSRTGYNTEHAVDTTLVSLLIARRLLFSRRELVELGTAAFLHDLGKLAMPSLLGKAMADLTEDEQFLMREHPVFGQQLLANSSDRMFMARTAILHHHERQDGLGYPLGLNGDNRRPALNGRDTARFIFPFAEIIAVADAYDNFISPRNGTPHAPEEAIRKLMKLARSAYNAEVTALLAEVISVFPTGAMVRIAECSTKLLEGAVGAVMRPSAERPHQPLVVLLRNARGGKITPRTVDLATEQFARLELVC
jgi:HD-GYP domain-containing protein (c-di-GMP phosphodiesterase class II)